MSRRTPISAVSMATTTRNDLNRLVMEISLEIDRRISVSTLMTALLTVARNHREELINALTATDKED